MNESKLINDLPYSLSKEDFGWDQKVDELDKTPMTRDMYDQAVSELEDLYQSEKHQVREEWHNREKEIADEFRRQAEEYFIDNSWNDTIINRIHSEAWNRGHSGGLSEVWNCYHDVVDFAQDLLYNLD